MSKGMKYPVAVGATIPVVFGKVGTEGYLGKLDATIERIKPGSLLAGIVTAKPAIFVRCGSISGWFTATLNCESSQLTLEMPANRIWPVVEGYFDDVFEW